MGYHFIITIAYPGCPGALFRGMYTGTKTTREGIFEDVFAMTARMAGANIGKTCVLFFSLEPNEMP